MAANKRSVDGDVELGRLLGSGSTNGGNSPITSVAKIDHSRQLYPYCILWSPIPLITWMFPFIGHTGIADSQGVIFDFAGPYTIGRSRMAFGAPTKYLIMDPSKCLAKSWDAGVQEGCTVYSRRMHNLFLDNCHSHVARCLNEMSYGNKNNYGMIIIGVWMFFKGSFISWGAIVQSYGPFIILICIFGWMNGYIF